MRTGERRHIEYDELQDMVAIFFIISYIAITRIEHNVWYLVSIQ